MFGKLIEAWKAKKADKEIENHPILGFVLPRLRDLLNDKEYGLGKHWSEQGKSNLLTKCLNDLVNQLNQPNPVQAVRLRAIEFQLMAAQFDVLIMQPPTACKELSGELKQHIPELAKVNKDLSAFFNNLDDSPTDFNGMWDAVLVNYWVMHFYMNAYNFARYPLGDMHVSETEDWFSACYRSLCIWQEYTYRQELGLPSNIEGPSVFLKAMLHSSWINRAEEGHRNLRLAWENSWVDSLKEPCPFTGLVI